MDKYEAMEKELKVIADRTRLKILSRIYQGEVCGCDLIHCLDISQPTLSHHLKVLSNHDFIRGHRQKNRILYTINQNKISLLSDELHALLKDTINC